MEEGALCLSSSGSSYLMGPQQDTTASWCDQDKHKAPSLPHILPLSLQGGADGSVHSLFRLSKFIRVVPAVTDVGHQHASSVVGTKELKPAL